MGNVINSSRESNANDTSMSNKISSPNAGVNCLNAKKDSGQINNECSYLARSNVLPNKQPRSNPLAGV